MNVTLNITRVPDQEAFLVDATTVTSQARRWIEAKRAGGGGSLPPLTRPMLSPRVPNLVPIPGPRMERETPGQRPRPNYGHPQAGISDVLAAKILGHIGDIGRFPSADRLASYAGTAPIEASSGDVVRHRLSRHGNRQLNNAIHLAAHTQTIRPGPGRDYYQRRRDTGNSRNEALRLLKRQLTKTIYRTLLADTDRTRQNPAT